MIGFVTLDVGEQALIYNLNGEGRIENGPRRIFLWREKFKNLTRYSANQKEYLVVTFRNGTVKHVKGPHVTFHNPTEHSRIDVKEMMSLDANEAIVVYRREPKTKEVTRYIKYGPTQFMPEAFEWLHEFCWHGTDPKNKTRMLPNILKFKKLIIIPDQFYYNVDEVRTADDALVRVKLMMFYELTNVEKMSSDQSFSVDPAEVWAIFRSNQWSTTGSSKAVLNATRDPIADFVNCLCADIVAFAAKRTYMEFIENSSELNDITNYPQLTERCLVIGYSVSKVVFRGYLAHDKLQQLHDVAIQKRTQLKLQFEKTEQEQSMIDFKLQTEIDRMNKEQEVELLQINHKHKMEIEQIQHKLVMEKTGHDEEMSQMKRQQKAQLNGKKAADEEELHHLHNLHSLDVNMTEYLVCQSVRPAKITRIIAESPGANFHLHHQ